jgi:hypothetical protein
VKNVGSSWSALATNVLVGIFLSPFILHRLGDAAYGIWVLIFSVTGYYGLFDLGIRSSIIRYISPSISANGTSNGVLWVTTGQLLAFDAVSLKLLYTTNQAPNGRDTLPPRSLTTHITDNPTSAPPSTSAMAAKPAPPPAAHSIPTPQSPTPMATLPRLTRFPRKLASTP